MNKNDNSKTILIIVAVVVGILLVGGIIVGASCYWLYKIGSTPKTTAPTATFYLPTTNGQTYSNARYGFEIKYPSTFSPSESQNGDGVTLTSSSPAITIRAYAANNSANQTLDEYLNFVRDNLFKESEGAEEIEAKDKSLSGLPAQERIWRYKNLVDSTDTIMDQVTALRDNQFYSLEMVISYADYSQYAPMFEEILASYRIE